MLNEVFEFLRVANFCSQICVNKSASSDLKNFDCRGLGSPSCAKRSKKGLASLIKQNTPKYVNMLFIATLM